MPHLTIFYSPDLERNLNICKLCEDLRASMQDICAFDGCKVFPTGGIRVLAFAANYAAIADGNSNQHYGFLYANLRMGRGRDQSTVERIGKALGKILDEHTAVLRSNRLVGVTFQIDESTSQVFDAKFSSLHSLFSKS